MNDEEAITKTALNYIEGWYEGNIERMQKALHPKLLKRRFVSEEEIWALDTNGMMSITAEGRGKLADPNDGLKEVTVLDIFQKIASVKIISDKFVDYLHLVKQDEHWVIVDALWDYK